jgi:hypothetical protein
LSQLLRLHHKRPVMAPWPWRRLWRFIIMLTFFVTMMLIAIILRASSVSSIRQSLSFYKCHTDSMGWERKLQRVVGAFALMHDDRVFNTRRSIKFFVTVNSFLVQKVLVQNNC